jgi:hypothetical protein
MVEEKRDNRKTETRESGQREKPWSPPKLLPNPDPQEGYVFRWVRSAIRGELDNKNVSQKFRSGWVPCKTEDHPELMVMSDINSNFEGNIEVGGMLLCKRSKEDAEREQQYISSLADAQMEGVDHNFLKEENEKMPLYSEKRTEVTFGGGRK